MVMCVLTGQSALDNFAGIWSQGLIEGMDEDTFEFPMSKPSSKMLYASHTSFDFSESKTTQCMPNFLQSNCPLHAGNLFTHFKL